MLARNNGCDEEHCRLAWSIVHGPHTHHNGHAEILGEMHGSCGNRTCVQRRCLEPPRKRWSSYNVFTSPPSMRKSEPVTLPARSLASSTTRSATSLGSVKRPVAAWLAWAFSMASASPPDA